MVVRPTAPWPGLVAQALRDGALGAPTSALTLVEWTLPAGPIDPRRYVAPLHVHHEDDEAWYVLEGRIGVRLGEEETVVGRRRRRARPARRAAHLLERAGAAQPLPARIHPAPSGV